MTSFVEIDETLFGKITLLPKAEVIEYDYMALDIFRHKNIISKAQPI